MSIRINNFDFCSYFCETGETRSIWDRLADAGQIHQPLSRKQKVHRQSFVWLSVCACVCVSVSRDLRIWFIATKKIAIKIQRPKKCAQLIESESDGGRCAKFQRKHFALAHMRIANWISISIYFRSAPQHIRSNCYYLFTQFSAGKSVECCCMRWASSIHSGRLNRIERKSKLNNQNHTLSNRRQTTITDIGMLRWKKWEINRIQLIDRKQSNEWNRFAIDAEIK